MPASGGRYCRDRPDRSVPNQHLSTRRRPVAAHAVRAEELRSKRRRFPLRPVRSIAGAAPCCQCCAGLASRMRDRDPAPHAGDVHRGADGVRWRAARGRGVLQRRHHGLRSRRPVGQGRRAPRRHAPSRRQACALPPPRPACVFLRGGRWSWVGDRGWWRRKVTGGSIGAARQAQRGLLRRGSVGVCARGAQRTAHVAGGVVAAWEAVGAVRRCLGRPGGRGCLHDALPRRRVRPRGRRGGRCSGSCSR
jgi:hypothetical protein